MSMFGVNPFDLSLIDQNKCPGVNDQTNVNVDINPETFSSQNIAGVVRKVQKKNLMFRATDFCPWQTLLYAEV